MEVRIVQKIDFHYLSAYDIIFHIGHLICHIEYNQMNISEKSVTVRSLAHNLYSAWKINPGCNWGRRGK